MNIKTEDQIVSAVGAEVVKQEISFYLRGLLRRGEGSTFLRLLAESMSAEIVTPLLDGLTLRVPEVAQSEPYTTLYNLSTDNAQTTQNELRKMLIDALVTEIQGYTGPGGDGGPSDYTQP